MITTTPDSPVERFGVSTERAFTIKASRKAFAILSSGLYSDKKLAIVREILCNAFDAHIASHNVATPVLVHLPNSLEPHFSIRDFGTGLSDESIQTIYTTYFDSTKTTSNDFTGCLGLGSKSPFSYVDSFTVVSYFDGVKRTYNAFIDQEGVPAIARFLEEETTEPNGLEVVIPVSANDFREFKDKLETVVRRFKVKPNVVGNSTYNPCPVEYVTTGKGWGIRKSESGEAVAVMGNIGYPIDLNDGSLTKEQRSVLQLPIDIDFPIGDLDIAASREKLSFDAPTIANIKARLDAVVVEIRDLITTKFTVCKTLWEARCLAYEIFKGEYKALAGIISGAIAIEWQGQKIETNGLIKHNSLLNVRQFSKAHNYSYRSSRPIDDIAISVIPTYRKQMFFWNDLEKGSIARIKNAIHSNLYPNVEHILLTPSFELSMNSVPVPLVGPTMVVAYPTPDEQKQAFISNLGIDASWITPVSNLPKPIRAARQMSAKGKARILRFEQSVSNNPASNWHAEVVDLNAGGVYVVIDRWKVANEKGCFGNAEKYFSSLRDLMKAIGLSLGNIPIYGVKVGSRNKLDKLTKWTLLADYCKAKIEKSIKDNKGDVKIADAQMLNDFESSISIAPNALLKMSPADMTKPLGVLVSEYKRVKADNKNAAQWQMVCGAAAQFGLTVVPVAPSCNLKDLFKNALVAYPMIQMLEIGESYDRVSNSEKFAKMIVDYVNTLDKI